MLKLLIAGNKAFPPSKVADLLKERAGAKYDFQAQTYFFKDIPANEFRLNDETVVPGGMAVEDPNIKGAKVEGIREFYGDPFALMDLVEDVDILVAHGNALPRQVLQKAKKLKCVVVTRGGPVNVDREYLKEKNIPLLHPSGRNATGVAELTVGLLLNFLRNLHISNNLLRQDTWTLRFSTYETLGGELYHRKVGLIGLGKIGQHMARILNGFESDVMVYDPYASDEIISKMSVKRVDLDELLKTSDIVSLHARISAGEPPLIGARELAMMKPTAILANTARGMLLDYDALKDALLKKTIAGAVLDVYGDAPFKIYKEILALPNVFGSSHLGGSTREAAERGFSMTVNILEELLAKYS